jgi:dihydroorotate dehydrogenase (NAD+) catalytic subunit
MTETGSGNGADHHRRGDANGGRRTGHPEHAYDSGSAGAVVDMTTRLAGVELPNPVMTASGCAAAGRELDQFFPVDELGAVVTKSIMLARRAGRATPRMAETSSGMLNSIGLQGQGIDQLCTSDLRWLRQRGARAVVSIAGGSVEEYAKIAERLGDEISQSGSEGAKDQAIALVEVNISCPNVEDRGQVFACDPVAAGAVVEAVRAELPGHVPVFAKLSPDVTDIVSIGRACVTAGADGLSAINTLLGMVIDVDSMRPALAGLTGGLSGPAIRPVAVRCIWQLHAALPDVPIIGVGGIKTGLDALELVLAGASAVQVGTTIFHDPSAPMRVLGELADALAARGFGRFTDSVGYAHRLVRSPHEGHPYPVGRGEGAPPTSSFGVTGSLT